MVLFFSVLDKGFVSSNQNVVAMQTYRFVADSGVVLLNRSLKVIAMDCGAAAILSYPNQPGAMSTLPSKILTILHSRKPKDFGLVKPSFHTEKGEYSCRACLAESPNVSFAEPLIVLHLEEVSSTIDTIRDVGTQYQLTDREIEVLHGISMGLTSRELGERMNISPNTVKAFLRLMMIKMGVKTRAGIAANILNRSMAVESAPAQSDLTHRSLGPTPRRAGRRSLRSGGI